MKKALLCVGNELRGDDGVAIAVGQLVEEQLPQWKVFFGYDTPEDQFAALRDYTPDIIVVVDAMSGFKEDKIEFLDLSDERTYIYSTHNLPTPILLSYLRDICTKTIFLGICVLLENVLHFSEGLSDNAKASSLKALDKIKELDTIIDN
ncbi:hydrogenase 3 maturation endopeptidase HyCI [Sulfurospirillum diekertiae]|uniref:Hydrogenase 3 maturation endopeptidase HyCI n=1 Tax=Sulfurospirillum diekertiae TaxID=1854492 RepID=A0A290HX71_9BACT|nr:hydrogenase 3 maturation endopeptidase HyCI [Sulfurospirillum diekertiae]ATB70250.1 hydrogenase 4 maturation protease [Sulfurospirillum diekertiae]QIR75312.1 hydrogenase 3 maturation endopeptidase HyCI [Sulfurospirillum diekertiae]QIR77964.1 hydrogenase 3 maturation endopeptidase HyCI [Sulfurospirillum diekertiae]